MTTRKRGRISKGVFMATVESEGKSAHQELTYLLSVDKESIVRQLAPIAAAQLGNLRQVTRLNGAVTLTVLEEDEAET